MKELILPSLVMFRWIVTKLLVFISKSIQASLVIGERTPKPFHDIF